MRQTRKKRVCARLPGTWDCTLKTMGDFLQELSGNKSALSGEKDQYICAFPCGILQIYFVTLPYAPDSLQNSLFDQTHTIHALTRAGRNQYSADLSRKTVSGVKTSTICIYKYYKCKNVLTFCFIYSIIYICISLH